MRIVLAFDGSNDSMSAVQAVARLPFREKPEITLVSAVVHPTFDLPQSKGAVEAERHAIEAVEGQLHQAMQQLEPIAARVDRVAKTEHPSHLILETAEDQQADLIVLGARGHSALSRILLGSTADYVVNHAKCSVLVVRPRARLAGEVERPDRKPSLCLAYDGHAPSKLAFEQLVQYFQWPPGTRLHVATMLERPSMLPEDVVYDEELMQQSRESQTQLIAAAQEQLANLEITYTVRETVHVGAALRNVALRVEADILFVGDTGKTGLGRILLGSTSRYLLHHVECAIWLARPKRYGNRP
ncbi:MAG: universal stress protein [Planctomycetota bacterium]|nr:MAG: universal stress protein [Planctomycetota bacterium]